MDDLALCIARTQERVLAGIVNADPDDAVAALCAQIGVAT
jgi:hypothetical protein